MKPGAIEREAVERIALKAAQIGYTYGALGRDFVYVIPNVTDMLAEETGATGRTRMDLEDERLRADPS
jgi:hypothetical protein